MIRKLSGRLKKVVTWTLKWPLIGLSRLIAYRHKKTGKWGWR